MTEDHKNFLIMEERINKKIYPILKNFNLQTIIVCMN